MLVGCLSSDTDLVRRAQVVPGVALVVAAPVVAWWGVGDLSEDVDPNHADYAMRPPPLSGSAELCLGAAASVVALVALAALAVATRRGLVARRWWGFVLPLVAIGVFAGIGYRVMTAAVIGANIGAGLVIVFSPFVVIPALALSATSWRALPRQPGQDPRPFDPPGP